MNKPTPTEAANDLLSKAMKMEPDQILGLMAEVLGHLVQDGLLTPNDLRRLSKQVFEVIKIRNHLAIMLHGVPLIDPRQFEMFDDLRPGDFE